jgi:hypothetical protein
VFNVSLLFWPAILVWNVHKILSLAISIWQDRRSGHIIV